jgi:hypothetical protein
MAYGTLKVDNITYTSGGSDASTTVSGLVNGNFPNIAITGTISGATITGNAGQFTTITGNSAQFTTITAVTGVFTNTLSGNTVTGAIASFVNVTGGAAGFTTVTGTTVTGTTANFASGVFTSQISGAGLQIGGSGVFVSGIRPSGFLSERTVIVSGRLATNSGISLGSGMAYYFLSGETSNATPNFVFNDTTTLDSQMAVGSTVAATLVLTPSTTGYAGSMSIDGSTANRTIRWQGGTAVTGGTASGLDVYSYQIIKTASNTFAVFVNRTNFA